jgi:hypothetical protein
MQRLAIVVLLCALGAHGIAQTKPVPPFGVVVIRDASGKLQGAFGPRDMAYQPSACCPFKMPVPGFDGVRMDDGVVLTAFGYYGWREGAKTHVRVLQLVPGPGAPNKFLWTKNEDRALLQPKDFHQFTISIGQTEVVTQMKALGLEPVRISLEREFPKG